MGNIIDFAKKKPLIILGLIIILFLSITFPFFINVQANVSQDAYWYMTLGKNFFEKGSYSLFMNIEHQKYPPGFPILIGLMNIFTNDYLLASRIVSLVCGIFIVGLAYLFGKKFGYKTGLLSAFLASIFFLLVDYSVFGMTETSFVMFTLLGAYLIIENKRETKLDKIKYLLGFGLIGYSTLIRYTGFMTLVAVIISELFEYFKEHKNINSFFKKRKNWLLIGGIIIFGLTLTPWITRNLILFQSMFGNAYSFEQYTPFNIDFFGNVFQLGIVTILFSVVGAYFYFKKQEKNQYTNFLIIYTLLIIIFYFWWGYTMTRFLLALVIPIAVLEAIFLIQIINQYKNIFIPAICFFLIIGTQMYGFENVDGNYYWNSYNLKNVKETALWTKENIPQNALTIVPDIPIYNYYMDKNDFLNITNYNMLNQPQILTHPDLYIIADEQHSWVSKTILENDLNLVYIDASYKDKPIRIIREYYEIKEFPKLIEHTPLFKNEYTSGTVKIFKFKEPKIIELN